MELHPVKSGILGGKQAVNGVLLKEKGRTADPDELWLSSTTGGLHQQPECHVLLPDGHVSERAVREKHQKNEAESTACMGYCLPLIELFCQS